MIRDTPELQSVTIVDVEGKDLTLAKSSFRLALFSESWFIFVRSQGRYYYPDALEFRLIDNNLSFLIWELGLTDMEEIKKLLTSSMLKEERWSNEFKVAVVDVPDRVINLKHYQLLPSTFTIPVIDRPIVLSEEECLATLTKS